VPVLADSLLLEIHLGKSISLKQLLFMAAQPETPFLLLLLANSDQPHKDTDAEFVAALKSYYPMAMSFRRTRSCPLPAWIFSPA
jgi:hypothetical protein